MRFFNICFPASEISFILHLISEIPDVLNKTQLNLLRNWEGELRFLQNFKLVRYTKMKLEEANKTFKFSIDSPDDLDCNIGDEMQMQK